ncbi:MAG: UvrB/UvrC motif-containing protein [Clostridia bacterium]|nr:UvrB/UvrC motif-containing protein [Clostridia bacterium]
MLCDNCRKREANTHIKRIINGEASSEDLCAECAARLGYRTAFGGFGTDFGSLFSKFFSDRQPLGRLNAGIACEKCGTTFEEIAETGEVGCPECYRTFYDKLMPMIESVHGNAAHTGGAPDSALRDREAAQEDRRRKAVMLREELTRAIQEENYEHAAELRDALRELEEQS